MTPDDVDKLIAWAAGLDPRISANPALQELWQRGLLRPDPDGRPRYSVQHAKTAIVFYYDQPMPANNFRPMVDPPAIRKIIHEEVTRGRAKQAALKGPEPRQALPSLRQKDPALWQQLTTLGELPK